jgi:hypothetical protein
VSGASNWISVHLLVFEGILITIVLLVDPEGLAGIVTTLRRRIQFPGSGTSASPAGPAGPAVPVVSALGPPVAARPAAPAGAELPAASAGGQR